MAAIIGMILFQFIMASCAVGIGVLLAKAFRS